MRRSSVRVRRSSVRVWRNSVRLRRSSVRMRRSSVDSGSACCMARVRISARHPRDVFPTERSSDEEMERNLGEWRRVNVLYECDGMNVCTIEKIIKINEKEWHHATKLLRMKTSFLLFYVYLSLLSKS